MKSNLKTNLKTLVTSLTSTKPSELKQSKYSFGKRIFINEDGTVADSIESAREFKHDKMNRTHGW